MRIASIPLNEELRLQDLYSYEILDSGDEKEFDELLEVAAQIYGCPIAAIAFVDVNRLWYKAKIGLAQNLTEIPREVAFCAHTILDDQPMIVQDTLLDDRFSDTILSVDGSLIRFYAGAPIISGGGHNLGAVCVVDNEPRDLTSEQAKALSVISRHVSKMLELRLKNKLLKKSAEEQLALEKLLLQKTLQQHENERFELGTVLHEKIAQGLAATKFYLELAHEGGPSQRELIKRSGENINSLLQQVKELSLSITPTTIKDYNLKDVITDQLHLFGKKTGMEVKLIYEGRECIEPDITIALYRIIEEQLANVQAHAKASKVLVNLQVLKSVYLSVRDNGIGVKLGEFKKGVGINKILSQVETLNGVLNISTAGKGGCDLVVTIPLQATETI
ncbi:MAG: GAF domain-containing protein [Chitinophagaceae bacterium]